MRREMRKMHQQRKTLTEHFATSSNARAGEVNVLFEAILRVAHILRPADVQDAVPAKSKLQAPVGPSQRDENPLPSPKFFMVGSRHSADPPHQGPARLGQVSESPGSRIQLEDSKLLRKGSGPGSWQSSVALQSEMGEAKTVNIPAPEPFKATNTLSWGTSEQPFFLSRSAIAESQIKVLN